MSNCAINSPACSRYIHLYSISLYLGIYHYYTVVTYEYFCLNAYFLIILNWYFILIRLKLCANYMVVAEKDRYLSLSII